MKKRFWENNKFHPIVGGVYRSWESELEIKENIKQRKQKKNENNKED